MAKQYSLSLKTRYYLRLTVFLLMVGLNVIFTIFGLAGLYGEGGKIAAITFSSLVFFVWLITCILADAEIIRSLFAAPKGYQAFLTPVNGWKILLGRVTAILTWDIPGFVLGVIGIYFQSVIYHEPEVQAFTYEGVNRSVFSWELWFIPICIVGFIYLVLIIFLIGALSKSIFFKMRAKALLGTASGILIFYVLSWLNMVMFPLGTLRRESLMLVLHVDYGSHLTAAIYLILLLLKCTLLFYITSYLMERRINI